MTLSPGTRLGPYEILAALGAGGMGEVYRARDTRLGRDVAVKVLAESFAADPDRLRRFAQEARAVAALNHPNILAVHDVGEDRGVHYLVSELLDGETLREKIAAGALVMRRAIEYALQIAHGLAAAHDKGIVHRDVKPENIFITRDGRVKILDFGLARLNASTANAGDADATLTSSAQTAAGVIMGTASYMAPEQVRGLAVDHRCDIFAFGAVLYEMLSGRCAFTRDSAAETMTAILKEEPMELSGAGVVVVPAVDRIVRRCLEKEPQQRFQSARDLAFALETVTTSSGEPPALSLQAKRKDHRRFTAAILIAVFAVAASAAVFMAFRRTTEPPRLQRLTFQRGYIKGARFTPDGQNIAYSASWEGRPYEIFSMRIGDHTARSLGLTNSMLLGVAANGDIAVLTNVRRIRTTSWMQVGTLARAPASGGAARQILEDVWDADISRDGSQFAVVRTLNGPHQLEYPVGHVLFTTNGTISDPRISPDGKAVAFMEHPVFGDDRGYVSLAEQDGKVRRLTKENAAEEGLAWSPDGREIFYGGTLQATGTQERMLMAVTREGKSRRVFQIANNVTVGDVAPDGRILISNEILSSAQIAVSPANGAPRDVSVLGFGSGGQLSEHGDSIVFTESGVGSTQDYLIYLRRLDEATAVELGQGTLLGLTPDGKFAVAMVPSQRTRIRVLPTGAGEIREFDVAPVEVDQWTIFWMPGAKEFVFLGHEGVNPPHAYRVSLAGGPARPLTNQPGGHFWNLISPDGKYVLQGPGVALLATGANWGDMPMELVDLATGETRRAPLEIRDEPVRWSDDNRHVFVVRETDADATVLRVDIVSGAREVWKQIRPADPAGLLSLSGFSITPSGDAFGYAAHRVLSSLYVYTDKQ